MSIRKVLDLKRASIQTQIDALAAKEAGLAQQIAQFQEQGHGLGLGDAEGDFQIAAMANESARTVTARLVREQKALQEKRRTLAREKLSLDIADQKLELEERKAARLNASRAADRA